MKLLISLILISIITIGVYLNLSKVSNKKQKYKKIHKKAIIISLAVAFLLLTLVAVLMFKGATAPDKQCTIIHTTSTSPPIKLESAMDYFLQGNYDYDTGNCRKAINNYTISVLLDPLYPQSYNNRAYTYMRMREYQKALPDLDRALELKPNYIQALMNRGDIHNYYFDIDKQKAISDYEKIIELNGIKRTSVCGHLFLARHNGWNLGTILSIPWELINRCR